MSSLARKFSVERITLIVAFLALIMSAWQGLSADESARQARIQSDLSRQQARQSVRPLLQASVQFNKERTGLFLRNLGLGPAVVTGFKVRSGTRSWEGASSQWIELLTELKQPPQCYVTGWARVGDVVPVGESTVLVGLSPGATDICTAFSAKLFIGQPSFVVEIQYKSLYDEPFSMSAESSVAINLDQANASPR